MVENDSFSVAFCGVFELNHKGSIVTVCVP
jgi:hypothetical protein